MKKNTNCTLLIIAFMSFHQLVKSQSQYIQYSYDQNGNRWQRQLIVNNPNPGGGSQTGREAQTTQIIQKYGVGVFPNPAMEKLNVNFSKTTGEQSISVVLSDPQGKIMYKQNDLQPQNMIDMTPYQQGVYYLKVIIGKEEITYKIMKVQ